MMIQISLRAQKTDYNRKSCNKLTGRHPKKNTIFNKFFYKNTNDHLKNKHTIHHRKRKRTFIYWCFTRQQFHHTKAINLNKRVSYPYKRKKHDY